MKVKVALFDFDNTIYQGDSINQLLKYYILHHPFSIFYLVRSLVLYIGYKLKINSFIALKSSLLFPIDKMSDKELECFYQENIIPRYYLHVVDELKRKKEEGYKVIICTASCEAYMKYHQLPIDCLIATQTRGSQIIGKNCKNEHKVTLINQYLKDKNYEIDFDHSYAYSDSYSDMPMLNMVKNKVRIELKTGKIMEWS
jgi:Haloacid Dehalogenase superfamily, subfamily IB, phosphoserine phosphatase-like